MTLFRKLHAHYLEDDYEWWQTDDQGRVYRLQDDDRPFHRYYFDDGEMWPF